MKEGTQLEQHFSAFRKEIIGINQQFPGPYGEKRILYADWTASGRLYAPIENRISAIIGPYVGNTHTETSVTGCTMTHAYHLAQKIIKKHVRAHDNDVVISTNSGMTGVVNKLQRLLGFKIHERFQDQVHIPKEERPIVFCTHMEHHSNQTSWLETIAEVEIISPTSEGLVDLDHLLLLLKKYEHRPMKIAAVTSCSNVTGVLTPYHDIAEIMHRHGGLCFVDFACSAPYIDIEMRPENKLRHLDAIYFSPHKFLGGPGSSGVLVFCPTLYKNSIPDCPGGGTVTWTDPWGGHAYIDNIEVREDGGTPGFLQTIKTALATQLKEEMGVKNILAREEELSEILWRGFESVPGLHVLAGHIKHRLGVFSFYLEDLHYNLTVRLLNDRFGIQARGGCSCAGTYGHYLLHISPQISKRMWENVIKEGDLTKKPGWVRISIHPTMTNDEAHQITDALRQLWLNRKEWAAEYAYNPKTNEFFHKTEKNLDADRAHEWMYTPLTEGAEARKEGLNIVTKL